MKTIILGIVLCLLHMGVYAQPKETITHQYDLKLNQADQSFKISDAKYYTIEIDSSAVLNKILKKWMLIDSDTVVFKKWASRSF